MFVRVSTGDPLLLAKKYMTIKTNIEIAPTNRLLILRILVFTKGTVIVNNNAPTKIMA